MSTPLRYWLLSLPLLATACAAPAPVAAGGFGLAQLQARLIAPARLGDGWSAIALPVDGKRLPALCAGGDVPGPPISGAEVAVVAASKDFAPPGGAPPQFLTQYALVFADDEAAVRFRDGARAAADACRPSVSVVAPATDTGEQPAPYTETVEVTDAAHHGWTGFVVRRHQTYPAAQPAAGDTAVAVLSSSNAVLVVRYTASVRGEVPAADVFTQAWTQRLAQVTAAAGTA
ncbi:hypothetical protein [Dactylosporangium sp. NPDC051541]|uniref:hypothetical protein n=1 Tax=Dactylosporangium sp. NPDC051541 TaxID=3363977 RepID=UPI0037B6BA6E